MKRKFEEEEAPAEAAPETTEESAPDSHDQFITLLTDMGLSAEQAEAVHQMAMDLANTTPEEGDKVEASRQRRRGFSRRGYGRHMGRRRPMARHRGMSADRPARRGHGQVGDIERLERIVKRQRRMLSEMRREMSEMGAQPGAAPFARRSFAPEPPAPLNVTGTGARARVFESLKNKL